MENKHTLREKLTRTPITTHRYNNKRYLTFEAVTQILNLIKEELDGLTVLGDEERTETAEMLYNFRNAIDIEGIKSILWQQAKHQLSHNIKEKNERL